MFETVSELSNSVMFKVEPANRDCTTFICNLCISSLAAFDCFWWKHNVPHVQWPLETKSGSVCVKKLPKGLRRPTRDYTPSLPYPFGVPQSRVLPTIYCIYKNVYNH